MANLEASVEKTATKLVELPIEGMTCTACARRIEKNLNKLPGVSAYVDFATEKAHVTISSEVSRAELTEVVEETGYSVGSNQGELAVMIWRMWVGLIIAAPVAIISMVEAWMPPNWHIISAFATAPVAIWVAWPFHSAAFKNLRQRATTMDTLVSLGVIVSYGFSLWQVFVGGMQSYFEVAAVVPTVVLFGRWLELRTRRSATDSVRALLSAIPDTAVVRRDGQQVEIPTSQVKVSDFVIVAAGQRIPVDGQVVEGQSLIDNSLITGESMPMDAARGADVSAGAVNLTAPLVLRAAAVSANSRIAQIADLVREATAHKAKITNITDRISSIFVPGVIGLSLLTYLVWLLLGDSQSGLSAAIAVLVIACPCALGIAVPMSLTVATSLGAKRGIVIRNPDSLEILNRVRQVVIDKTGTLTTGQLRVSATFGLSGIDAAGLKQALAMAAAVERSSVHPLAKAIAAMDQELTAVEVSEVAGAGAAGTVNGVLVRVASPATSIVNNRAELDAAVLQAGAKSLVVVSWGGEAKALIALEDDVRLESKPAIEALQSLGIEPILLSGDAEARVSVVAKQLGIEKFYAGVAPEAKLAVIERIKGERTGHSATAMVGDGLNDVAALAGADVGIAMGSGTHAAQAAASVTIIDDSPMAIPFALELARRTWLNIKQNLGWAFGYNLVLIPVAALGLLNPMYAGAAMAFSSVSVVLNALRLRL
jgi:Cu+-exporting ATPase